MSHRGQAHARRRVAAYPTPFRDLHTEDGTTAMISGEWDDCRYDDVIPHRLRGTIILDDEGWSGLTDLVADRSLT